MKHAILSSIALIAIAASAAPVQAVASAKTADSYQNIEMLTTADGKIGERSVRVEFRENSMALVAESGSATLKEFRYADIVSAEYSYTKNPRWKTGLGLGAAAFIFPPLFLVAIPVGFTKHRRHWVTVRTADDFVVLKVGKGVRKMFIPAFETHTAVRIAALGDDK